VVLKRLGAVLVLNDVLQLRVLVPELALELEHLGLVA